MAEPTLTVAEVLERCPQAARMLINRGMHCVGCAIAPFETLAEACLVYGVPLGPLLDEIDRANERR